jgi:hypothetical protein
MEPALEKVKKISSAGKLARVELVLLCARNRHERSDLIGQLACLLGGLQA